MERPRKCCGWWLIVALDFGIFYSTTSRSWHDLILEILHQVVISTRRRAISKAGTGPDNSMLETRRVDVKSKAKRTISIISSCRHGG